MCMLIWGKFNRQYRKIGVFIVNVYFALIASYLISQLNDRGGAKQVFQLEFTPKRLKYKLKLLNNFRVYLLGLNL